MKVSLIAALGRNREIGKDNDLLWHLPSDMKFFRDTTLGHYVIMGRRNYESIPERFRPFAGRTNVVISRNADFHAPGCIVCSSLQDALHTAEDNGEQEAFIIGGEQIYALALQHDVVDTMYLTHVDAAYPDAHAHFPEFFPGEWRRTLLNSHGTDERHAFSFDIFRYDRNR
ncbi:MAG: dihydrofolate reductase [Flavobacteriales bacterium]|jgi:dihydrofolate reductase